MMHDMLRKVKGNWICTIIFDTHSRSFMKSKFKVQNSRLYLKPRHLDLLLLDI